MTDGDPRATSGRARRWRRFSAFTVRYVAALTIIGALSVVGALVVAQLVAAQGTSAGQINVAGRQRMLTERIALEASLLPTASGAQRVGLRRRLSTDATAMLTAQHDLLSGDKALGLPGHPSRAIRKLYDSGTAAAVTRYGGAVRRVLATAAPDLTANDPTLKFIQAQALGPLLIEVNAIVAAYQLEAQSQVKSIEHTDLIVLALILCMLGLEATFVFAPLDRSLMAERARSRHEAEHDPLTGVLNRRGLERCVAHLDAQRLSYAVLIGDLDRFKSINDTYGHDAGDAVLAHTAQTMRAILRPSDLIARYGGEEFVIVLPLTGEGALGGVGQMADGRGVAERIRLAVEQTRPDRDMPACTLSFGVAEPVRDDLDGAIESADRALYRAKANGRNRVEVEKLLVTAAPASPTSAA
jgi:diguanylate cyclase (GGDEF)-like protein